MNGAKTDVRPPQLRATLLFPSYPAGFTCACSRLLSDFGLLATSSHASVLYPIPVCQARCLPLASSRFRLAADTLAVGCMLPAVGEQLRLSPIRVCPCWAKKKKSQSLHSVATGMVMLKLSFLTQQREPQSPRREPPEREPRPPQQREPPPQRERPLPRADPRQSPSQESRR